MNNIVNRSHFQIKILAVLILSLLLSGVVNKGVFIANSPRINMVALSEIKNSPLVIFDKSARFIASLVKGDATKKIDPEVAYKTFDSKTFSELPTSQLKQVTSGVYAKEKQVNSTSNIIYIRVAPDAQWEEKQITLDGKPVTLRIPKGSFK